MSGKLASADRAAVETEKSLRVTFFLPGEKNLARLRSIDPDREPAEFVPGERAWILQTYLRLAAAGHPVDLEARPPERGILVFHAKQVEALLLHWRRWKNCVMVGVRADHSESHLADFEVLQNGVWADGDRRFFVPGWPQPGLVARDPARGDRIERVAFKGFRSNLAPELATPAFAEELRRRGIELEVDAVDYRGAATDVERVRWSDYRNVDVVLALRPPGGNYTDKPATKLYNAWFVGAPAVLGPDPAFRELRQHELDYLEVTSAAEALAAIDRLRADPALYRAMIEHGRERSPAFSNETIRQQWVELLFHRVPELSPHRAWRSAPAWLRPALRKADRLLSGRPPR